MIGVPEMLFVLATAGWLWALVWAVIWAVRFARAAIDAHRLHRTERILRIWRETDAALEMHERHMKAAPTTEEIMRARQEKGL